MSKNKTIFITHNVFLFLSLPHKKIKYVFLYRVVSGSRDATLRVWSIPEGRCLRVLVGHLAAVRCVQYDGKVVVSGAYDYFVKVWNPDTGECLHTLAGHTNRVYSLQVCFSFSFNVSLADFKKGG